MQVFVTLDSTFQTHLWHSRPPTRTMKKTWMPYLIRRRWGKPTTNSFSGWRGKRRRASRTWPAYCHTCPRLHKGLLAPALHVCGRGYGGQFSPSTGQRSYMFTPSELRLYRHAQDHRLLSRDILGYPSLFGNILAQPLISNVIPLKVEIQIKGILRWQALAAVSG